MKRIIMKQGFETHEMGFQDNKKTIKLKPKKRCAKCKMLYWKKHKCRGANEE